MAKDTIFTLIDLLRDPLSRRVREKIERIADLNTNVLLCGETGVGKDIWVRYLHAVSRYPRMLNLNCGDVPEHLLESEWFGYRKGAFTGAERHHEGRWSQAQGGILFLNQIDLLSLNLQSRLLRIIERKKFFPLGSNREVDIDVRFVFSTGQDIEEKVRNGRFRSDLFYRISSFRVDIPPLRERRQDILPLLSFFAGHRNLQLDLSPKGIEILHNYRWPGNIREIENLINGVAVMSSRLTDDHLQRLHHSGEDILDTVKGGEMSLYQMEKEYITWLLDKYRNKVRVADILGISRKSLYNKLKRYDED